MIATALILALASAPEITDQIRQISALQAEPGWARRVRGIDFDSALACTETAVHITMPARLRRIPAAEPIAVVTEELPRIHDLDTLLVAMAAIDRLGREIRDGLSEGTLSRREAVIMADAIDSPSRSMIAALYAILDKHPTQRSITRAACGR